ncbi:MAG: hypothetical protein A2505_04855 [Deltaproteobacteria bacterium RIFOXYD12_FULL_55_16]|nr:MAG: hypothetical protein A2505_04855 [Deltaproteobacteria bacterium RIFOXYD12_FULL_55_16]
MHEANPFVSQAKTYDDWFTRHPAPYQAELAAISTLLPTKGKGLEIGVGTGRFAAPLGIGLGVEPVRAMAAIAQTRGITVVQGVAEALPLANGLFDFALMVTVDCFLDDLTLSLREANRVLGAQACLLLGFIDRESRLGLKYLREQKKSRFYRQARFHSPADLEKSLRAAGFGTLHWRQTLLPEPASAEQVLTGYGQGGFVVIRAEKG